MNFNYYLTVPLATIRDHVFPIEACRREDGTIMPFGEYIDTSPHYTKNIKIKVNGIYGTVPIYAEEAANEPDAIKQVLRAAGLTMVYPSTDMSMDSQAWLLGIVAHTKLEADNPTMEQVNV